jgi:hypothetical protein
MELIARETPSKAAIVLKSSPNAPMELDTPPKAPVVLETLSTASIILDMPSKICQDAHCSRNQVVTPDLMPEPSTPFSSFLLRHASNAAARITSLLQPSPSPQMDVMTFDEEEEHTIVFDEIAPTPSTLAPSVTNMTPLEMEILPHLDDELMIVFETEMVTPVCFFRPFHLLQLLFVIQFMTVIVVWEVTLILDYSWWMKCLMMTMERMS